MPTAPPPAPSARFDARSPGAPPCARNRIPVRELFGHYERVGLAAALGLTSELLLGPVRETWERAVDGGLLSIFSVGRPGAGPFASAVCWRAGEHGLVGQYLTEEGGRGLAARVVREAARWSLAGGWARSVEDWPGDGPTPPPGSLAGPGARVPLGRATAGVRHAFDWTAPGPSRRTVVVERLGTRHRGALCELARSTRGPRWTAASELAGPDPEWNRASERWRVSGLAYDRPILVARRRRTRFHTHGAELLGAALVHRGPPGLSLSFLENRVELLLHPGLSLDEQHRTAHALCDTARNVVEPKRRTIVRWVVGEADARALESLGGRRVRTHRQRIWTRPNRAGVWVDARST